MASSNKNLIDASKTKDDEFYTQLSDIENELSHYKSFFKDKVVFCNCDDPFESNFFKYFAMNFNYLGIKKLITTCYAGSPIITEQLSLFEVKGLEIKRKDSKKPYKIEITEVEDSNGDGAIDLVDVEFLIKNKKNTLSLLKGNGDFRSKECINLLKESDIVVTNPPFSLFNEYVNQLMEYKKQFIIIGSKNAVNYKEIFPLIKDNKLWLGYGFKNGNAFFRVKDGSRFAKGVYDENTGLVKFRNCAWYTNLDVSKRHEKIILYKKYSPEKYPKYYNYDGIDVGKIDDIPNDYYGLMGVPVTFMDYYNPEQFKLIGLGSYVDKKFIHTTVENEIHYIDKESNKIMYRFPYTVSERKIGNGLRIERDGKPAESPYGRIIIQRIDMEENINGN